MAVQPITQVILGTLIGIFKPAAVEILISLTSATSLMEKRFIF